MRPLSLVFSAFLVALAFPAQAALVDFSLPGIEHGSVIGSQYNSDSFGFLQISAENTGGGPDLAVAYNSSLGDPADPDLNADFLPALDFPAGDLDPGNILIVQENATGCGDGICNAPDDEGGGGVLSFAWAAPIVFSALELFDIDSGEEALLSFFDGDGALIESIAIDGSDVGHHRAAHLDFEDLGLVGRLEVTFSSSGAISNLEYEVPVPEPGTALLLSLGLVGLAGRRKA